MHFPVDSHGGARIFHSLSVGICPAAAVPVQNPVGLLACSLLAFATGLAYGASYRHTVHGGTVGPSSCEAVRENSP